MKNLKTVGELIEALKEFDPSTPLSMSSSSYDFESDDYTSALPRNADCIVALDVTKTGDGLCEISNSNEDDLEYWGGL